MTEILISLYPWIKALHIMAVIAWMAGLFYLPRLFVYHAEQSVPGDSRDEIFQVMERKLFRFIMRPSMVATWIFGLLLGFTPGIVDLGASWPYAKLGGVLVMTWFHVWLGRRLEDFAHGKNTRSGRRHRIMNELPTVAMIVIVLSVVVKF